ncbi:MAG: twin-arginine translocation signal domain-containing protein [Bacteroidetes bacterium]|nr:twin-arginine translocation signal domain-containing protein [Bacteroidota bacterium]
MKKIEITNTDQTVNSNKHSRRSFIKTAAVGGLSVGFLFNVDKVVCATQKVNKSSRQMKLKNNRNLYNGDFGVFFWNSEMWQPEGGPYSAKAIHRFVDLLADSGVDTFLINPNSQVAWYPSKAIPTVLDHYVRDDSSIGLADVWWTTNLLNPALDLKEADVDCLAEAIGRCRERGISPWISVRMNDPHLGHPYLRSPLYQDGQLNYERQDVRDYYFSLIREVVEEYGSEGLELDWLRSCTCCPSPASQQNVDMMTSWFSDIRVLTEAKAKRTGRRFPLGMRIPGDYKRIREIGIDVEVLVRNGLLDFICPTHVMNTSWAMPYDRLRAEFGEDITIYGVTELMLNELMVYSKELDKTTAPYVCASAPALRGNAAGKLVLGADGIQQYNFFVADQTRKFHNIPGLRGQYAALRNIYDLESLRGQPKHYSISTELGVWYGEFDLPRPLPVTLDPDGQHAFALPMCAEPTDRGLELIVQIVVEKKNPLPKIGISFNDEAPGSDANATDELLFPNGPSRHHLSKYQAYNYRFDVNKILEGWNELVVFNKGEESFKVMCIDLAVKNM